MNYFITPCPLSLLWLYIYVKALLSTRLCFRDFRFSLASGHLEVIEHNMIYVGAQSQTILNVPKVVNRFSLTEKAGSKSL